jgi:pilus assembly protein Flp/PilA
MEKIWKFIKEEEGLTMVEYAVMAVLISAAVVATVVLLGETIDAKFNELVTAISN